MAFMKARKLHARLVRDEQQENQDPREGQRVVCRNPVEQAGHETCQSQSCDHADGDADDRKFRALEQNQSDQSNSQSPTN